MAITVLSTPADFHSLHDDAWFVVSSDNVTQDNFKFVFDVIVSGGLVARVKATPSPSAENSYGIFNSAPIVRNYFENYFEPSGTTVLNHVSNKLKIDYEIQYGEEVSGILTSNLTNGAYAGYNFYPPLFFDGILSLGGGEGDLLLSSQYDNLLISNYADDWLTERDKDNVELIFGKRMFISFLFDVYSSGYDSIEIQKINEDGTNNGTSSTGAGEVFTTKCFAMFNFSAAAINEYLVSEFITEDNYGYKVRLNFPGSINSNWITIKHVCYPRTNPVNVHFLNRLGGYDTFGFNLVNKRSTRFDRKSFRRASYQLSGSEMTNNDQFNRYNEGKITFSNQHTDSYRLISDYVSENDYHWLAQLVASSIAYLEVNGAFFPITFNDTNYEYKLEKSDQLFNLEIGIEVGKYNNSQYR
jgi:hypothetical protein